jgi:hypothetical protein
MQKEINLNYVQKTFSHIKDKDVLDQKYTTQ